MTLSKHQIEIKIVNEPLSPTNSILDGVISKATAKQTENRYLTCAQLWCDMERIFIKEKIILDNETTVIENRGKKEKEKRPFNWMLLFFVLIMVSCVGFIFWKKAIFFPEEEKQELSSLPTIETVPVFSVFQRDALSGGTISSDGGLEILEKGIVWSTNQNPDISLSTKTNEGGNSSNFNSTISNLLPGTRYYVRAYATNSIGTAYGQEQTFVTEREAVVNLPQLTTRYISSIMQREAMSGGAISFDGGSEILAKGIVWSKNREPNISMSTKTNEGGSTSSFISKISNLTPNTRYYVRAYATNSVGTEYGQEQTFMTEKEAVVFSGYVTIGTQVWQTKNLNVDRFRNGDPILQVRTNEDWKAAGERGEPAWCYYENNASNGSIYGKLYNWHAATDSKGICPPGWHLPSDREWTALTNYLGGENVAGGKMKSAGTAYWNSPNTGATNESGFSVLPGGCRYYVGSFFNIRNYAFFWSASENDDIYAWNRNLSIYTGVVSRSSTYTGLKSVGASVRCLRD
jgi:uncharacterized protein (TIGR02145 family)